MTIQKAKKEEPAFITRPPVVTILGHIDHGKSTLLDYIRKTNIVEKEAGGITQHISAYEIKHKDENGNQRKITFVDTPGHEAFHNVRSRGAQVADIAILIVSAEDGVMPQTKEALKFIKKSDIPFIVAITKIDSSKSDIERTKSSLIENEIYLEGLGGDIPFVPISSKTGEGINDLLYMIILMADMEELKTNPESLASGIVVEAHKDCQKGISATVIIKDGKLDIGKFVASHTAMSPIRSLDDTNGEKLNIVQSSTPIIISGWNDLPLVGSDFKTFSTKKEAEEYCKECENNKTNDHDSSMSIQKSDENTVIIPLIIKTDVSGTGEAIIYELKKLNNDRVIFNILKNTTGNIGEADMKLAIANENTVIVGMGVNIDTQAEILKERDCINVVTFKIIYDLIEYLEKLSKERRPKIFIEEITGKAKIIAIFNKTKKMQVLGGKVKEGTISIGNEVKILRRNEEIGKGRIKELQQQRAKAEKIEEGNEFGAAIETNVDIMENDHLEAIKKVES